MVHGTFVFQNPIKEKNSKLTKVKYIFSSKEAQKYTNYSCKNVIQ